MNPGIHGFDSSRRLSVERPARIPSATYRLQFNREFTFNDAAELVDYLDALGISDAYASPLFHAGAESTHGYDVCDFTRLNSNLGTEADFDRFSAALKSRRMGLLLDIVPNHMGIAETSNSWWMNVLEHGADSALAHYFDIDWQSPVPNLRGKVLLPVLGEHFGTALEKGQLRLSFEDGGFWVRYFDKRFPVAASSFVTILDQALKILAVDSAEAENPFPELQELRDAMNRIFNGKAGGSINEDFKKAKAGLSRLHDSNPRLRAALSETLKSLNGTPGISSSFDELQALLDQQNYRLAFWRVGPREINYRRFFEITGLAAVRVESPEVFAAVHELAFRLLREGKVTGLRIDHPDGLWDPATYFQRLQEHYASETGDPAALYVVAEKIISDEGGGQETSNLAFGSSKFSISPYLYELLPEDWPVHGTTGYDFLNVLNGLFVHSEHEAAMDRIYRELGGAGLDLARITYLSKRNILTRSLASELSNLAFRLKEIAARSRHSRDYTLPDLQEALIAVLAAFPVYRTYVRESAPALPKNQQEQIDRATRSAGEREPHLSPELLAWIRRILTLENFDELPDPDRDRLIEFVMKFQQLASPAMAKGLEDTSFYNYHRLVSLNEVGGNPARFGVSVQAFHQFNQIHLEQWPHSLLATATHDTKRGEDVRARINVLSEIPEEWEAAVRRWMELNEPLKTGSTDQRLPERNTEYLLYQTLVGAWPETLSNEQDLKDFRARIAAFMIKSAKEAKLHTGWIDPNKLYEDSLNSFVAHVLERLNSNPFLQEFLPFQRKVAFFGRVNSLAQTLLKIVSPGVPDFYQGTEVWDLNLVDPDNRRCVDYSLRRRYLSELTAENLGRREFLARLLQESSSGRVKMFLIRQALHFRRSHPDLFRSGSYHPLNVEGGCKEHLVGFARSTARSTIIVAVPRLTATLMRGAQSFPLGAEIWGDTWVNLPEAMKGTQLRNIFTGETISAGFLAGKPGIQAAQLFQQFPFALAEQFTSYSDFC
jgi:(1->4)-alpha-D-glucan 1-alpha-D-glucosylmutase